jgi:hypothetical protein
MACTPAEHCVQAEQNDTRGHDQDNVEKLGTRHLANNLMQRLPNKPRPRRSLGPAAVIFLIWDCGFGLARALSRKRDPW